MDMVGEVVARCPSRVVEVKISSPDLGLRRVAVPLLPDKLDRCLLKRICSEDRDKRSGVVAAQVEEEAEAEREREVEVEVQKTGTEVQIHDRVVGAQEGEVEDIELTIPSELVKLCTYPMLITCFLNIKYLELMCLRAKYAIYSRITIPKSTKTRCSTGSESVNGVGGAGGN